MEDVNGESFSERGGGGGGDIHPLLGGPLGVEPGSGLGVWSILNWVATEDAII